MLPQSAEDALISAVRSAARTQILPRYRRLAPGDIRAKSRPDDLVTEADLAVENLLARAVAEILPGAHVLGEEAASADPGLIERAARAETCVIIDPVDGTWNFANGISVFGTILAVQRSGETVWGLLYDPLMDDWIVARRGGGAWYVRPGMAPQRCVLAGPAALDMQPGFLSVGLFPREMRGDIAARVATAAGRFMGLRCSCHEYRALLGAAAAWSVAPDPLPWDHAAGVLAIVESGGHAAFAGDAAPYDMARTRGTLIVAPDRALWDDLHRMLAPVLRCG